MDFHFQMCNLGSENSKLCFPGWIYSPHPFPHRIHPAYLKMGFMGVKKH